MKKIISRLFIVCLLFSFCQCSNKESQKQAIPVEITKQEDIEIRTLNEKTWEEARAIQFSDSDFLKTKQPMSDDAIAPYDYHTGLVGDKAYNQVVYIKALERAKRNLIVENNQLILIAHSGHELKIAEDLYDYIVDLIKDWNKWINEGRFRIVKLGETYYDIAPIPLPKSKQGQ